MKSPMLYAIRQKVIEGRRQTQRQRGKVVRLPILGIKARLLEHPSPPFHYVAVKKPTTSGAWRSQKNQEQIYLNGELVWELFLIEMIHRKVPSRWREELRAFLDLVYKEKTDHIWLDTDFRFWTQEWSEWSFDYNSDGNFELYQGSAEVFRRGTHIYTGICSAGVV